MSKKQATIFADYRTSETGASTTSDFVVDGDRAAISLQVFDAQGTAPTVALTVTELFENGITLDYEGQTANFTVGRQVKGSLSNAKGLIVDDTDAGATGTLHLKKVSGSFRAGEPLTEVISGAETSGAASVTVAVPVAVYVAGSVWASIPAGIVDADVTLLNPALAAGDGDRAMVHPRRFRLGVTAAGTWTSVSYAVDLVQSGL